MKQKFLVSLHTKSNMKLIVILALATGAHMHNMTDTRGGKHEAFSPGEDSRLDKRSSLPAETVAEYDSFFIPGNFVKRSSQTEQSVKSGEKKHIRDPDWRGVVKRNANQHRCFCFCARGSKK